MRKEIWWIVGTRTNPKLLFVVMHYCMGPDDEPYIGPYWSQREAEAIIRCWRK